MWKALNNRETGCLVYFLRAVGETLKRRPLKTVPGYSPKSNMVVFISLCNGWMPCGSKHNRFPVIPRINFKGLTVVMFPFLALLHCCREPRCVSQWRRNSMYVSQQRLIITHNLIVSTAEICNLF